MFFTFAEPPSWSAPKLPVELVTMVNVTSQIISVNCSAYGRPPPVIQWTKDGQLLDADFYQVVMVTGLSSDGYRTNVTSLVYWRGAIFCFTEVNRLQFVLSIPLLKSRSKLSIGDEWFEWLHVKT